MKIASNMSLWPGHFRDKKKKKVVWETRLAEWWENICLLAVWCDCFLFVKQSIMHHIGPLSRSTYSRLPLWFYLTSNNNICRSLVLYTSKLPLPQSCWEYVLVYSEQFSNDCWKTNTTSYNLLKIQLKKQGVIGLGFASHLLKNWCKNFKAITKCSNHNQVSSLL